MQDVGLEYRPSLDQNPDQAYSVGERKRLLTSVVDCWLQFPYSMDLLVPDSKEPRPSVNEVLEMCRRIQLKRLAIPNEPFDRFLSVAREKYDNGGADLGAFEVGADRVFDWFASRNRLSDDRLLDWLVLNPAIVEAFPELQIPSEPKEGNGFGMFDQFLFDGALANMLYHGGAYSNATGDGRNEKQFALEVCDAMFGLRYGEISCNMNYSAWTPWFKGIAWDLTAVVFDRRVRRLWMLTTTDTD